MTQPQTHHPIEKSTQGTKGAALAELVQRIKMEPPYTLLVVIDHRDEGEPQIICELRDTREAIALYERLRSAGARALAS